MKTAQKQKAKELYLQSGLNKTQIAKVLGISRRSLHYWVDSENWARLKKAAEHLPSMIVEDCYYLLRQILQDCMGDHRLSRPLTRAEAETIYRLTLSIQKLKNRSTLNESIEMFALLQDGIKKQNPALAKAINPFIEKYLSSRADVYLSDFMPAKFNRTGYIAYQEPDYSEGQEDHRDIYAWEQELATLGYVSESRKDHNHDAKTPA